MQLVIMTRGRLNKQRTVMSIPNGWKERAVFLAPPEECGALEGTYGITAIPFTHGDPNYSNKFQAILEGYTSPPDGKVCILDDDLVFSRRIQVTDERTGVESKVRLQTVKPAERHLLTPMFDQIEYLLETYVQVGVHPRQMGQNAPLPYKTVGKVITVNAVDITRLKEELDFGNWRVDEHPILADTRLNCEVLGRGHKNALVTQYCVDWGASQAPGGCDYRTMEMQSNAVHHLAKRFDPYLKVKMKEPKAAKWLGNVRVDYTCQWKKLYEAGYFRRQNGQLPVGCA